MMCVCDCVVLLLLPFLVNKDVPGGPKKEERISALMVLIKQQSFFVILPILNHVKRLKPLKQKNTRKQNMTLIVSS